VTVLCLISSSELDVCSWLVSAVSKLALSVGCIIASWVCISQRGESCPLKLKLTILNFELYKRRVNN